MKKRIRILTQLTQSKLSLTQPKFSCPCCGYRGSFISTNQKTGYRKYARCPLCGSAERHRLQKLVLEKVFSECVFSRQKILHFAPEAYFQKEFQEYVSSDLSREDVMIQADMTQLPFGDNEFDFVFASHVLEHIVDDLQALQEIKRILKPNGIAVLPVPIISDATIEYSEPNPHESGHVRAPGKDYFERYQQVFSRVDLYSSLDFPQQHQTFLYEDRSHYPNKLSPLRQPSYQDKYEDIVPVCMT